ncbi:MAG: hypothetical protein ACFWTQ_00415 [Lactococcus sp.]|jgi:hypothetical protein
MELLFMIYVIMLIWAIVKITPWFLLGLALYGLWLMISKLGDKDPDSIEQQILEMKKLREATVFEHWLCLENELEDVNKKMRRLINNERLDFDIVDQNNQYDIVLKDSTFLGTVNKKEAPLLSQWLIDPRLDIHKSVMADRDWPSKFQVYLLVRDTTKY